MAGITEYVIVGAVAAIVTLFATPLSRTLAVRIGAVAAPSARKVHDRPTPSLGGLAMLCGVAAGFLTAWGMGAFDPVFRSFTDIAGVAVAALIIFAVGLLDDVREVSAPAKVAGIVLAGVVLALADWRRVAARLSEAEIDFILKPQVRFKGEPGEQWTMFFTDPCGNPIELKGFARQEDIFAL